MVCSNGTLHCCCHSERLQLAPQATSVARDAVHHLVYTVPKGFTQLTLVCADKHSFELVWSTAAFNFAHELPHKFVGAPVHKAIAASAVLGVFERGRGGFDSASNECKSEIHV